MITDFKICFDVNPLTFKKKNKRKISPLSLSPTKPHVDTDCWRRKSKTFLLKEWDLSTNSVFLPEQDMKQKDTGIPDIIKSQDWL